MAGIAIGMTASAFLFSPVGIKAMGQFFNWMGTKAFPFLWNSVCVPVGKPSKMQLFGQRMV